MKKAFFLILFVFLSSVNLVAQTVHLQGTITDKKGNVLIGATVYLPDLQKGTVSTADGTYELNNLPQGNRQIVVSFIGYDPEKVTLVLNRSEVIQNFTLVEKAVYLEGLVVTAQKREQSIKDIPTAISSLDAKFLDNAGITTLDDLSEYVPGMEVQLQSPNNPGFVIRGITSDDGSSNVEPRVSVFQDGVSISKSRGSVVEVYDMERVEVLKGPQGTLFGRGAQIGAIDFIQNKAKNNTSGSFIAGYGDYNYMHAQGFFNTPLVKDKLFVRVAGIYKKRDGYIKNLSGGDLNGKDTKAFRTSLRYMPSIKTTFDLIYNYQHDTPPGTAFKSGTYAPKGGDTKPWTFADLERGKNLGVDRTVWGTTLIGKHNFSDNFSLTSITAYREFDSYESFDADGTAAPALWFAEDAFGKQFSQEFRTNFKINERFEGFAGTSYFYENGHSHIPLETNEKSLSVLFSPLLAPTVNSTMLAPINAYLSGALGTPVNMQMQALPLVVQGNPYLVDNLSEIITDQAYIPYISQASPELYAMITQPLQTGHTESYTNYGKNQAYEFFADGTYKLTDWLSLTAGLRLTFEHIESSYSATSDPNGHNGTLGFARSAGVNDLFMPTDKITESDNYTSMVGRLAFNFKLKDQLETYLNISRGRRPNVIQFKTVVNEDGLTSSYEPEKLNDEIVWSYEAGLKGLSRNQQLYYDLACYYYDYSDFQTQTIENLQFVTKDAGSATAYGFETSAKWQINKIWQLLGNYAFIHATFDDTDSNGNKQEYAGNTFRLTPKNSFSLGVNCTVPLSQSVSAFVRPTYNYKSKVYFEEDNGEDVVQDGFGLLNCRAGLMFPRQQLSLQAFLTNALDERYIIDAGNTGRNFGIPTYIAGAPRMFGLEIRYSF